MPVPIVTPGLFDTTDKRKSNVLHWAEQFLGRPVDTRNGWTTGYKYPEHNEIVLFFDVESRQAYMGRHISGHTYDILTENHVWFHEPPDIPINPQRFYSPSWRIIPKNLYNLGIACR